MQVMKRTVMSTTETLNQDYNAQISYNSDGRLAVRYKNPCDREKDTLIVFDNSTSEKMIKFCQELKIKNNSDFIGSDEIPY